MIIMKITRKERLRFKISDRFYRTNFPDQKGIITNIETPYRNNDNTYVTGLYNITAHMEGDPSNVKAVLFQSGIRKIK